MIRKEKTSKPEKSIGNNKAISMSNTKKITTTIKNFIQKGRRAMPLGSKPHSKGEAFSLSRRSLRETEARVIRIRVREKQAVR